MKFSLFYFPVRVQEIENIIADIKIHRNNLLNISQTLRNQFFLYVLEIFGNNIFLYFRHIVYETKRFRIHVYRFFFT